MPSFAIDGDTVEFDLTNQRFGQDLATGAERFECAVIIASLSDFRTLKTLATLEFKLRTAINAGVQVLQVVRGAGIGTLNTLSNIHDADTPAILIALHRTEWTPTVILAEAIFLDMTGVEEV